ncbi:MAG: SGNH/GDSL hydrolase family protein [Acidobacteriota bacterium]
MTILMMAKPAYAEISETEWVGQKNWQVVKVKDMTVTDSQSSLYENVPCEHKMSITRDFVWAWNSYYADSESYGCYIKAASGDFDRWQAGIAGLNGKYLVKLTDSAATYRTLNESSTVFLAPNTNRLVVVSHYNRSLWIADDFRSTFSRVKRGTYGNIWLERSSDYDFELQDDSGKPSGINSTGAIAFSDNSRWMVFGAGNNDEGVMVRIDLSSGGYEILPFAPPENSDSHLSLDVSNSGRFVAIYSSYDGLHIYDLDHCGADRGRFVSRNCAVEDVNIDSLREMFGVPAGRQFSVDGVRFTNESNLVMNVGVNTATTKWEYAQWAVSVPSFVPPEKYLALGDSFSSGEGAGGYYTGTDVYTDENNYNKCHQSKNTYSEVLGKALELKNYDSIACSGAMMRDVNSVSNEKYIDSDPQSRSEEEVRDLIDRSRIYNRPGYIPQRSVLDYQKPTVATLTIGGNDIGFGDIVTACVLNADCYASRDNREYVADLIASKIPELARTYEKVKSNMAGPAPRLYVVGYPRLVTEDKVCNGFMDLEERKFANALVDYLNASIELAAKKAGVRYIDVADAFIVSDDIAPKDYRICSRWGQAVNGLVYNTANASSGQPLMNYFSESFHPNAFGQMLIAKKIRRQTDDFSLTMSSPEALPDDVRPPEDAYQKLVGDTDNTLDDSTHREILRDLTTSNEVTPSQAVRIVLNVSQTMSLVNIGAVLTVQLHSTPTTLGTMTIGADGIAAGTFDIPPDTPPGIHEIHVLYEYENGVKYDFMQHVLVVASDDDYDGDGVKNEDEACVFGTTLGIDYDKDGVDDACDVDIHEVMDVVRPEPTTSVAALYPHDQTTELLLSTISQPPDVRSTSLSSSDSATLDETSLKKEKSVPAEPSRNQSSVVDDNSKRDSLSISWLIAVGAAVACVGVVVFLLRKRIS